MSASDASEDLVLTAEQMPPETDIGAAKRVLETVLLASQEPISVNELRRVFDNELSAQMLRKLLEELRSDWLGRGVELVQVASGWRFQTRPEFHKFVERLRPERPARYSRAVMETLAIIAYRQPVTRGDIEEIRGVTVSSQIVKTLEARGWIEVVAHKEVPGRPEMFGTTKALLDDLNLRSLQELPPLTQLEELEAKAEGVERSAEGVAFSPEGATPGLADPLPESAELTSNGVEPPAAQAEALDSPSERDALDDETQLESDFLTTEPTH